MKALVLAGLLSLFFTIDAEAQYQMVDVERTILCESFGGPAQCNVGLENIYGMRIARELSYNSCYEGQSFAMTHGVIRVRNGCRAYFVVRGATAYPGYNDHIIGNPNGPGHMSTVRIRCESSGHNTTFCRIPLARIHDAYLETQLSGAACIDGRTFFIDLYRGTIEVSRGCRAIFVARGRQ